MAAREVDWDAFLADFHRSHPGITEQLLSRSFDTRPENPYQWLATHVPNNTATVLDIGCGSAPMQRVLPAGISYVGLDVSIPELRIAQHKGDVQLVCADALRLPFSANSIDVVVSSMALMLLSPIAEALGEISRVLKPGGAFAVIRPASTPFVLRDVLIGGALMLSLRTLPAMPQRFSASEIKKLLDSSGFERVRSENKRFALRLENAKTARLTVAALYLPTVSPERRESTARFLAFLAPILRAVPVSVALTTARKR